RSAHHSVARPVTGHTIAARRHGKTNSGARLMKTSPASKPALANPLGTEAGLSDAVDGLPGWRSIAATPASMLAPIRLAASRPLQPLASTGPPVFDCSVVMNSAPAAA